MGYNDDLQSLGILSGGAQGFIKGWQDADERKMRQIELDAKIKSQDEDKKRQAFMTALTARHYGFQVPEGQDIYDTKPSDLQYDPQYMKMQQDKLNADPFGLKALQVQNAGLEGASKKLEINKKQKEAAQESRGFKLPPDKVLQVQAGAQIPTALDDISKTLDANSAMLGPVKGRMGAANPYDEKSQTIDAQMRAASQQFGRFMEGGVLRKEDEEKYRKMFPQLSDEPGVAKNKLALVRKLLTDKHNADIRALSEQGYDTSGFRPIATSELPKVLSGKKNGLVKEGLVGAKKGMLEAAPAAAPSEQDRAAIEWALKNPKDPRAAAILKANGQ